MARPNGSEAFHDLESAVVEVPIEVSELSSKVAPKPTAALFVKLPMRWAERLPKARRSSLVVAIYLLRRKFERPREKSLKLSNEYLTSVGVKRSEKGRALRELEELGLIKVERYSTKAPVITLLE